MAVACFVENEELWIVEAETGSLKWRGQPDGYPVWRVLPIPGSDDGLVLLRYDRGPRTFPNLLRLRPDGSVVWRAELPEQVGDTYVGMEWSNGSLTAGSWSGFEVVLDPDTGRLLAQKFTKGMS